MALSQENRMIRIATPLPDDTFVVLSFNGSEELSELFNFEVELASERSDITFDELAGKNVTVSIRSPETKRFFNGMIVAFAPDEISRKDGHSRYRAMIAADLWSLTQCMDCRIFQNKTVVEIIQEVLSDATLSAKQIRQKIEFKMDVVSAYPKYEYCVQYNESDYDFICRLCEQEGIFFYFEHTNGRHSLVFADSPDKHAPFAKEGSATVRYQQTTGSTVMEEEVITYLQPVKKMTTGKYSARDYNFKMPDKPMDVHGATQLEKPKSIGEFYEYPGGYERTSDRGDALAKIRIQSHDAQLYSINGQSNCRCFAPGYHYTLTEHTIDEMNDKKYVFISVGHEARQGLNSNTSESDHYSNEFVCIPHSVPYRPLRNTRRPLIVSSQTAIVTGPKAEEIHTDEHGRVKVKFFWDRRTDEKGDGNMSCWIRVSQNWAGGKWGAMHIPRVGQEVIVNFLDGDPDRPIITGRVYHGLNKPPYDLPAEKTKSTIKSNSTKDGNGNFNEIRFEDLKDKEEFFTHAAKDQNEVVENDMSTQVGNNQLIQVENDRTLTVTAGSETHTVASGGRSVSVKADEKHINDANYLQKVSGNFTLKVNGNLTLTASGMLRIEGAKVIIN